MVIRRKIRQLLQDQRGIAAVEFALILPFLILLFLGGFELSRFLLINQKVDKSVYAVADIVSQQTSVTNAQLGQIILAASEIMRPQPIGNKGRIILTSVYKNGSNAPVVQWQYAGGGTLNRESKIGKVGKPATLPGGLTLNDKDNVIISEFYYEVTPLFTGSAMLPSSLYKFALFKPRLGLLTTPPS
ncbi:TadE/TadG family type IV pilus assembly protein [Govanella unica]|uniref:Pilus assembly protein n=1 Tax=Govanella unica TaxID=2975056 RepID=A0A9X3TYA9_9PROT|nr:tight adherence pilus pseudopilin TadF [Govania unica]MDA5193917.1 pilus assembly protein [Govania unica]